MKKLSQVSHCPRETTIRIDCNQLGSIPNTNPGIPHEGSLRSPLVQLRSIHGFDQCRTLRDWSTARTIKPSLPLDSHPAPRTSLLPLGCALLQNESTTWIELLGFAVGTIYPGYVQNDERAFNDLVLNRHRWNHYKSQHHQHIRFCPVSIYTTSHGSFSW
jgi:hypothetical protein